MAASGALFNFEQVSASTYHVYLLQLATAAGIGADTVAGNECAPAKEHPRAQPLLTEKRRGFQVAPAPQIGRAHV